MRVLAELLEAVESETPFGGRAVSYEPRGVVWLAPGQPRTRARGEADVGRTLETRRAFCRADPRLVEGRVLRFGGADWRIVVLAADGVKPGRCELALERER